MPFIGSTSGSQGFGRGSVAGPPIWVSSGSLGTLTDTQRAGGSTFTVSATPGPGAVSVTYSLVTGSLPAGASLNGSSGVISGFSAVSSNTTTSFTLRATNNAGLTADAALSITINAVTISWTSPASQTFASQNIGTAYSKTYLASASSGTIAYTQFSGTVPTGTSIASNGSHTGTIGGSAQTFTWTVRATVTSGSATATVDQSFSQPTVSPALYTFTNVTFSSPVTGVNGPDVGQARGSMSGTPAPSGWNTTYFTTSGGKQIWTVPATGNYQFVLAGARAGDSSFRGGNGAQFTTNSIALTQGEVMTMVIGQRGVSVSTSNGSGGGGGTSLVRNNTGLLAVAGGGGGNGTSGQGRDAQNTSNGGGGIHGGPGSVINNGGSGGAGGNTNTGDASGTCGWSAAGWSGNGPGTSQCGRSGGTAAQSLSGSATGGQGEGGGTNSNGAGGFGGGGGGANNNGYGGGGGGYSGGGAGGFPGGGGGGWGGSFSNIGINSFTNHAGTGFITATRV